MQKFFEVIVAVTTVWVFLVVVSLTIGLVATVWVQADKDMDSVTISPCIEEDGSGTNGPCYWNDGSGKAYIIDYESNEIIYVD